MDIDDDFFAAMSNIFRHDLAEAAPPYTHVIKPNVMLTERDRAPIFVIRGFMRRGFVRWNRCEFSDPLRALTFEKG